MLTSDRIWFCSYIFVTLKLNFYRTVFFSFASNITIHVLILIVSLNKRLETCLPSSLKRLSKTHSDKCFLEVEIGICVDDQTAALGPTVTGANKTLNRHSQNKRNLLNQSVPLLVVSRLHVSCKLYVYLPQLGTWSEYPPPPLQYWPSQGSKLWDHCTVMRL